jgi:hypothetical protein
MFGSVCHTHCLMADHIPVPALADSPAREPRAFVALAQLCLGLAIFGVCLCMPRPGGTALLIPAVPQGVAAILRQAGLQRAGAHGITVLRSGWIAGSVLVRIDGDIPVLAFLRAGVVPLGAPAFLCTATTSQ